MTSDLRFQTVLTKYNFQPCQALGDHTSPTSENAIKTGIYLRFECLTVISQRIYVWCQNQPPSTHDTLWQSQQCLHADDSSLYQFLFHGQGGCSAIPAHRSTSLQSET
jgi:hypothetical protein